MLIPSEIRKCVAFAGLRKAGVTRLVGTLFFVLRQVREGFYVPYVVTAKHVVDGCRRHDDDEKLWLRLNLKGAGTIEYPTDYKKWFCHPTDASVDVAVLPFVTPELDDDHDVFPMSVFGTDARMQTAQTGPGDEVFITGLFRMHYGGERNQPIIRVGNIAAIPDERVKTSLGYIEAYLIEARSIGGLSGSPVFALLDDAVPPHQMHGFEMLPDGNLKRPQHRFFLLGLIHGHFDVGEQAIDADADGDAGQGTNVNTGIGIVVPAKKIIEVFEHPDLIADAHQRAEEYLSANPLATTDEVKSRA